MIINITEEQLKKFDDNAFELYISELIEHCQLCYPKLTEHIPTIKLRAILADEVYKAKQDGVNQRASVRFYIDLKIIFGAGFKTDPQYEWISEWLKQNAHYSQLEQADFLYFKCIDYLQTIYGENNLDKYELDNTLASFNLADYIINRETFDSDILTILKKIHPKKAALIGDDALKNFITHVKKIATKSLHYNYVDQNAYLIIMSYLYGHQFNNDPFLPTITAIANTSRKEAESTGSKIEINQSVIQAIQHWGILKSI